MIGTYMGNSSHVFPQKRSFLIISAIWQRKLVFRSHPKQVFIPVIPRRLQTKAFLQFHLLGLQVECCTIHCRYDLKEVMSMEQLQRDIDFLAIFTNRFANAAVCPVAREIPEDIKKQLDEYLFRKRKDL